MISSSIVCAQYIHKGVTHPSSLPFSLLPSPLYIALLPNHSPLDLATSPSHGSGMKETVADASSPTANNTPQLIYIPVPFLSPSAPITFSGFELSDMPELDNLACTDQPDAIYDSDDDNLLTPKQLYGLGIFPLVRVDAPPKSADAGPSTASTTSAPPSSVPAAPVNASTEPVQQISMRSLIVTQDASIIIGRGGSHVNEIRVSAAVILTSERACLTMHALPSICTRLTR